MDVRTALEDYYGSITLLRPLVQEGYRQRLEVFCDWCQERDIQLEQLNDKVIQAFVAHVKATHVSHKANKTELSSYTLKGYVKNIKQFLNWCLGEETYDEILKPRVINRIKQPKADKTIIEVFTPEQLQALFDACEQEFIELLRIRNHAILSVLIDTGIRADELITLTMGNVNLEKYSLKVMGKGRKERPVWLGKQSMVDLENYLETYRRGADRTEQVFINRQNRKKESYTVSGLEDMIRTLGKRAEITGVRCSPHTFRHTYACSFLLQGGSLFDLSRLMGHERVEITQIYLKTIQARRPEKSVLDTMGLNKC